MHIAVFIKKTTLHAGFGGMETQNKLLCEGLAKLGHRVEVFSPVWELQKLTETQANVVYHFVKSNYRYLFSSLNPNSWPNRSFAEFKKLHEKDAFDIVVSQSSAGIGIIQHKNEMNIKIVSIAHGSAMGELKTFMLNARSIKDLLQLVKRFQYALRQFFLRQRTFILNSNKVIAVSNAVKRQLVDETYAQPDHIIVINNGAEVFDVPEAFVKMPAGPNFVFVGQLTRDKGVELFIEMASDPRFKEMTLDIIGDGPLRNNLQTLSQSNAAGLSIRLLGKLPYEETIKRLSTYTGAIFLFPTRRIEGFPMVLVEAMFAGMPVIGYDLGGVADAVINEQTGYLIPFEDKKTFLNKLLELKDQPSKILELGQNARKYALENFTIDIMLSKYEKLFGEVLKQ